MAAHSNGHASAAPLPSAPPATASAGDVAGVGSTLSPLSLRRAAEELGETEETRGPSLESLRRLVIADSSLRCRTDDAFLIKFLRHRKFNVEQAHQRIRAYLHVRNLFPDVFENFCPEGVRPMLEAGVVTVLPERDAEGRRLIVYRVGKWDCGTYSSTELVRANGVVIEAVLEEEDTQVNGIVLVVDMSGLTFRHMRKLNIDYFKRFRAVVNKAMPVRVKQINILRGGMVFDTTFRLISFMMSQKIADRIRNHGNSVEKLHAAVDPCLLPSEEPFDGSLQLPSALGDFNENLLADAQLAEFFKRNSQQAYSPAD